MEPPDRVESDLKNLVTSAAEWTLADDHQICNILSTLASNIEKRGNSLEKSLNNLLVRTGKLDAAVQCLNVDLSVLKNSKFIEVIIDEDEPRTRRSPVVPPQKTTDEQREEVISTVKSCINESLKFAASSRLDMRLEGNLPPLIGSKEFMEIPVKQAVPFEQPETRLPLVNKHPAPTQSFESDGEPQESPTTSIQKNSTLAADDFASVNGNVARKTPSPVQNNFMPAPVSQPAQRVKGSLFDYDSSDSENTSHGDKQPSQNGEITEKSSLKPKEAPGDGPLKQDTVLRPPTAAQLANAVSGLRSIKKTVPEDDFLNGAHSKTAQKAPPIVIPKPEAAKAVPKVDPIQETVPKLENKSFGPPITAATTTTVAKSTVQGVSSSKPSSPAAVSQKKPPAKSLFDETDSDEDLFKPVFQRSQKKATPPVTQKVQKTDPASDAPKTEAKAAPRATSSTLTSRAEKYKKLFDSDSDGEDLFKTLKAAPSVSKPVKDTRAPSPKALLTESKEPPRPLSPPKGTTATAAVPVIERQPAPLVTEDIETPRIGPLPVEEPETPISVPETVEDSPLSLEPPTTEGEMPIKPTKTPGRLGPSSIANLLNAQLASGPRSMRRSIDKEEKSQVAPVAEKPTETENVSKTNASSHLINPTLTRPRPPSNRKRPSRFAGTSVTAKDASDDTKALKDGIGSLTIDGPGSKMEKSVATAHQPKSISVEASDKAKTVTQAPTAARPPRKGLFDSDSDDDLFSGAKKPLGTLKKSNGTVSEPKKKPAAGKSLFDSDDEDLSLFRKK